MAQIPQARKNPYEAAPEKLPSPSPDPLSDFDTGEQELIRLNLSKMDQSALNDFYKARGLSDEEQQAVQQAVDYYKSQDVQAAQAVQDIQPEQPVEQPVAEPTQLPETGQGYYAESPSQLFKKYGTAAGKLAADLGVSVLAESPALAAGALGTAIGGPVLGGLIGGGVAVLGTETADNLIRDALGMDEVKYEWWQKALSAAGPAIGVARGLGRAASVSTAVSKEAALGAKAIRESASKLASALGDAQGLNKELKMGLVKQVDSFMEEKILYNKNVLKMSDDEAAKAALAMIPEQIEAQSRLEGALGMVPEFTQAQFERLQPTKQGFMGIQAESKARMAATKESLSKEVESAISSAKKKKMPVPEGLQVPHREVLDSLGGLLEEASPLLPTMTDGSRVVFKNGQFFIQKGNKLSAFTDSESRKMVMDAIRSDDYLSELYNAYKTADSAYARVIRGSKSGQVVATTPINITLDQLGSIRQKIGSKIAKSTATGGALQAERQAYSAVSSLEEKYLQKLENSGDIKIAQVAQDYRQAKDLSNAAASVLDPVVDGLNADPSTTARAFLNISDDNARKFMRLKREGVGSGAPVVNEDMPQFIAGQILRDKFGTKLFPEATADVGISLKTAKSIPGVVDEILADKNLVSKLKIYLGDSGYKSMIGDLKKVSKTVDSWATKINIARNATDPKVAERVEASVAAKASELVSGGTAKGSFWIIKSMLDAMKVNAVSKRVNQVVYSRYLDDVVKSLGNNAQALKSRAEIIEAFGKDNPVALRVLKNFDDKVNSVFSKRRMKQIAAQGLGELKSKTTMARKLPVVGQTVSPEEQYQAEAQQ